MQARWFRLAVVSAAVVVTLLTIAFVMGSAAAPLHAQAPVQAPVPMLTQSATAKEPVTYTVPMTGAISGLGGEEDLLLGTFGIAGFDWTGPTVFVRGYIDISAEKSTIGNIRRDLVLPIAFIEGGCGGFVLYFAEPILPDLPDEPNPPGVFLSPVVLSNGAEPGADPALDAALCSVGRQVAKEGPASAIANQLNRVLRALQ